MAVAAFELILSARMTQGRQDSFWRVQVEIRRLFPLLSCRSDPARDCQILAKIDRLRHYRSTWKSCDSEPGTNARTPGRHGQDRSCPCCRLPQKNGHFAYFRHVEKNDDWCCLLAVIEEYATSLHRFSGHTSFHGLGSPVRLKRTSLRLEWPPAFLRRLPATKS